jgi:hypothetical protein
VGDLAAHLDRPAGRGHTPERGATGAADHGTFLRASAGHQNCDGRKCKNKLFH